MFSWLRFGSENPKEEGDAHGEGDAQGDETEEARRRYEKLQSKIQELLRELKKINADFDSEKDTNRSELFARIKSMKLALTTTLMEMDILKDRYPSLKKVKAGGDLAQLRAAIVQSEMETGARDLVARRAYNARLAQSQ